MRKAAAWRVRTSRATYRREHRLRRLHWDALRLLVTNRCIEVNFHVRFDDASCILGFHFGNRQIVLLPVVAETEVVTHSDAGK